MKQEIISGSLLGKAHELVRGVASVGDTVVDATVGNGYDTRFLAETVGDGGKVIGFDVQLSAIEKTRQRLIEAGICQVAIELHQLGHEEMLAHVSQGVSAVMFNLGYLPGSDKQTITRVDTTLRALDAAIACLSPGGLLSVMCYPGHDGGDKEAEAVIRYFAATEVKGMSVMQYTRAGGGERSAFLLLARKRGASIQAID